MTTIKKYSKLIGLLIVFIVICVILCYFFTREITVTDLRGFIESFGVWAPLVFVLLVTVLPAAFFPVPILTIAAGLMFGFWEGALFSMIGIILNSTLMFYLAKVLAKDKLTNYLKRRLPEKWAKIFWEMDPKRGFWSILVLRFIPVIPNNLINYGAGVTPVKFRSYTLATILGVLPGTLVFINIGDKAADIYHPNFIIAIILLIVLAIVSLILVRKLTPSQVLGAKNEAQKENE